MSESGGGEPAEASSTNVQPSEPTDSCSSEGVMKVVDVVSLEEAAKEASEPPVSDANTQPENVSDEPPVPEATAENTQDEGNSESPAAQPAAPTAEETSEPKGEVETVAVRPVATEAAEQVKEDVVPSLPTAGDVQHMVAITNDGASASCTSVDVDMVDVDMDEVQTGAAVTDKKSGDKLVSGQDSAGVKEKKEVVEKVSLRRLFQYADGFDRALMFLGVFFGAGHGCFLPAVMIIFGDAIGLLATTTRIVVPGGINMTNATGINMTNATQPPLADPLAGLVEKMGEQAIQFCGLAFGVLATTHLQVICWSTVGERLTRRIRRKFLTAVLNQDISWFDTHKCGELASRMSDDLVKVYGGVGDKNGLLAQWITTAIAGIVIGFVKSWKLTIIIVFGAGPFLAISGAFVTKLVVGVGSKEQDAYAKAGAVAGEVLSSVRTVVAFGGEKQEAERYDKELEEARVYGVRKGLVTGFGFAVVYLLLFCTYGLGFYVGTLFTWRGEFTVADMLTTFFSVLFACFSLGNAGPSVEAIADARAAAVAVYNIIDAVPTINSADGKGQTPEKLEGNFRLENVHFKYPSRPDAKILNGLTLDIKSGTTVALVGPSGCGKSTCLQLIQRFYDVLDGSVKLDGVDVRDLNVKWLRSQIGVVGQEPVLFQASIAENIADGSLEDVGMEDIVAAAKKANAHDFISGFPDGYDTQVGERGAQMSGGQKQRIAIARALVRNPRILLLDEATSALDTESERVVQAALETASEGRTTIIIAHRLTTVRNADCIVAVEDGEVKEFGSHDELMDRKGLYYKLVSMQSAVAREGPGSASAEEKSDKPKFASQISRKSAKSKSSSSADADGKEDGDATQEEEEDLPEVSMLRLLSYNRPEYPMMVFGAFCALCYGVVFPLFGFIFAEILTVFQYLGVDETEYFKRTNLWSGMFPVLGIFCFLALLGQHYFFAKSGAALTKRMRSLAFQAILRQNIAFFDDKTHSTGALATRLSSDAALIQGATGGKLASVFQLISTMVAALGISFSASWHMTLLILGVFPLIGAAGAANTKALAGHGSTDKDEHLEAGKIAVEVIDNVRTVASLGLEERSVDRYMAVLEPAYRQHKKKRHVHGFATGMSEAMFFLVYAITFGFGAFLIEERLATFNNVFKVFGAMIFAGFSLGQSAAFAPDVGKARKATGRVFKLLDTVPEIDVNNEGGDKPESVEGTLELKDITFRYPTRPEVPILAGTTIQASAGQTIALVGQSGCGKSTSVSLLERFYDPLEGVVSLDGRDIKSLNLAWLRRQMGIVQQEPVLFDASVADNISYGALNRMVTIEEIHQVAKKANIHDFISGLPDGYDTNVGSKGTQLSGGQKQRVAIARALIRNPKILLLDEATSALDTESEKVVQEALDAARQGRTSIVIAHRLSTIHNSDNIIVLGGGKVLEQGTHAALMSKNGAYCKLNKAQETEQS